MAKLFRMRILTLDQRTGKENSGSRLVVKCADRSWQSARSGSDLLYGNGFLRTDRYAGFAAETVSRIGYRRLGAVNFQNVGRTYVYTFSALFAFTFVDFRQEHSNTSLRVDLETDSVPL